MLCAMRALPLLLCLALPATVTLGQAFEVASVRPSQHEVGPDYNNQFAYSATGLTARNATLKRLIAEAFHLQLNQISGPGWLDRNEYDNQARAASGNRQQMEPMLRNLLTERFNLKEHRQTREMRVYVLAVSKSGARIHPASDGESPGPAGEFHFHGSIREFADLLAIKLSIPPAQDPGVPVRASGTPVPVLDKTGLPGVFDFRVNMQPELGTDAFTLWQRALEEQLGLQLENRKDNVEILVVDNASKMPTEN